MPLQTAHPQPQPRSHEATTHEDGDPMKRFACGDVVPGCDATFVCDGEDDVLVAFAQHAARDHAMPRVPDEVIAQVRERMLSFA